MFVMPTMWLFLVLGVLTGYLVSVDACTPFTFKDWHNWGSCSRGCAGGIRTRYRYYCHFNTEDSQSQACNEWCYFDQMYTIYYCVCNGWRYGECCEACNHYYYISNCYSGYTYCNDYSYPFEPYCSWCYDPYYPSGSTCEVCPRIDHCPSWRCNNYYDSTCYYCDFDNYLFKLTDGNTKCSHMCSWNSHYCWPGYCSDSTKDSCVCDNGFSKVAIGDSETSCQLASSNVATIETCFTTMKSSSGDMVSAGWQGSSTSCAYLQDFYGNFVPTRVSFELYAQFSTSWTSPQPSYIANTQFGLTDVVMETFHTSNGHSTKVGGTGFHVGTNYHTDLKPTYSLDTDVTFSSFNLNDGDQLCVLYTAYAGGYLEYYDLYYAPSTISSPVPYDTTIREKILCYRYDITSPKHCADYGTCSDQPVLIADRIITTNTNLEVHFRRWSDPVPYGMSDDHASGIESYELTVHEVMASGSYLQVSTSVVASQLVTTDTNPVYFNVASSNPKLYAVYLTVKDVANNVRQSRAFALYDDSSYITTTSSYPFYVESAVKDTGYTWQMSYGTICLNWVNHFYNVFYIFNPLLNPIHKDPHRIANIYDQHPGDLPISGTPNVDGIIGFNFRYDINGGSISSPSTVPDFLTQSYCHSFDTTDGYSYTLYIDAYDIAGHTYEENRTVYYDSSVPEISNFYLVKDGVHGLYVHDRTDLSTMNLHIEAKDGHSGIQTIYWKFGISVPEQTLTDGYINVDTIEGDCLSNSSDSKCYCPSVGLCELYDYILPLNKLVSLNKHNGDHNRHYFFEVTVWNTALLYYTTSIDILADESPPETGVVQEGPVDEVDIDYTSEDTFMVHWHGFIDHESDIKEYHIALAPRCLSADEMANLSLVDNLEEHLTVDHPETSARLQANFTGKMYTTMVAMNNAMDPSYPVCSDGITRDVTAPRFEDIVVRNARWSESLLCWNSRAWLLTEDMSKLLLNDTTVCQTRCAMSINTETFPAAIPTTVHDDVDEEFSDLKCDSLPTYSSGETIVYLPDDHIHLEWRIDEDGSQIDDFHVGFGMDPSEEMAPGHVGYVTSKKKLHFDRHHIGISSSQLFYMFLKADSKSGLTTIAAIGPLLIDESPPLAKETPEVVIEDPFIMIQWNNDTFYDLEQSESIHQVYYQFVTGNSAVTPLTEWREEDSSQCPGHDGPCIKYGLGKLQEYDTEAGNQFYAALYIHNRAGHVLEVNTGLFQIPSNYPPGNAILFDVDPDDEYSEDGMDVNVHFTESTLCAKWIGFRHHESITIEIGVGSSTDSDDVVSFTEVENTGTACVTSASLLPSVKYHALVRASCSGGQTTAVSNGVTILTQTYVDSFLTVRVGRHCPTSPDVVQLNQITAQEGNSDSYVISTKDSLEVGKSYNVYLPENSTISVDQSQGELTLVSDEYLGEFQSFVPYVHNPVLVMSPGNTFIVDDLDKVKVVRCPNSEYMNLENDAVYSWWYFSTGDIFASAFETGFLFVSEDFGLSNFLEGRVSAYQHTKITKSSNPIPSGFEPGSTYRMGVRACVGDRCLEPALSDTFVFVFEPPVGYIRTADITFEPGIDCVNVNIKWDAFTGESPVKFYQWTLSEDELATKLVIDWNTTSSQQLQVNECLVLPHNLYRTLYACVSAYTEGELVSTVCRGLRSTSFGAFRTDVVYDVDTSAEGWDDIKSMIATSNLGQMYSVLHDSELDLSTTSGKVAGVIMYGTERTIDWFLMETAEIPDVPGFSCSEYFGCLGSGSNMDGYMEFNTTGLSRNTLYYICAKSEETSIEREFFTETLEELNTCSDGFALDDQPPTCYGKLHVTSATNGYLTKVTHVLFSWDACQDNNDAKALGYIDNIKSYSYAVGRRPGGDDIIEFTDVGLSKVAKLSLSGVPDGSLVYISVKATDHAGLSASMTSQELTVETSAPSAGALLLNQRYDTKYISTGLLNVRPVEFHDEHTGIYNYQISVGSAFNADDILATTEFTEDNFNFEISGNGTYDGLRAVITVKAINRAGLVSEAVTTVCVYDTSPPIAGNVQDGDKEEDVDSQTDVYSIKGHWGTSGGFDDPHSGIQYYSVGLGSKPYEDDIEQMTSVGSHIEMTWHRKFSPGQWYYITVEACNYADLCTKKASNGIVLDNSAPIHGLVRVGSSSQHQIYIPRNSSVHIHWVGFEDPQSGMERFEACVGTAPGDCNIVSKFNCLLQSNILKTGLTLPVNSVLYATVFAYNKVGMLVQQSSNVFRVDNTAPVLVTTPSFLQDHKSFPGFSAQPEPSLLSLSWQFEDNESPITEHTITLKTHHEGHTPIETVLLGNENSLTTFFDADNWLKSGDRYYVVVTACNAAGHCTSAQTEDLLIDSSPPHLGGFRSNQLYSTNTGDSSSVTLGWYGFHDQESDVLRYFITISKSYSGYELTDGVVIEPHNSSSTDQTTTITLSHGQEITHGDMLVLSIWAQNHAGINSSIARVSVFAIATSTSETTEEGFLDIERHSCDVHYCNNDCTCALIERPCVLLEGGDGNCVSFNNITDVQDANLPVINVYGGLAGNVQEKTASSACLAGHWEKKVSMLRTFQTVLRYEWSMGLLNEPVGFGVFDLTKEIPWNDVGHRKEVVHCLNSGEPLLHGDAYVIYVRAWYSENVSAIFQSTPITVDHTAPKVLRGRFIKDSDPGCVNDYDFIDWQDTITACWTNVFLEEESDITHFSAALGTSPNADDVISLTNVGLNTTWTLTDLSLSPGTKYYFSVTAYNSLGLHIALTSDGFVVDVDKPTDGVVYTSGPYQSSNDSFSLSWHGFVDHFSGVRTYHAAVAEEGTVGDESSLVFVDVGFHNAYTLTNLILNHGSKYVGAVKTVDTAGHESDVTFSQVTTIDTTPPEGYECNSYDEVISETVNCSSKGTYSITGSVLLSSGRFYTVVGSMEDVGTAEMTVDKLNVNVPMKIAHDGSSTFEYTFCAQQNTESTLTITGECQPGTEVFAQLSMCNSQLTSVDKALVVKQIGSFTLQTTIMVYDVESKIQKLWLGLGTKFGGFQLKSLDEVYHGDNGEIYVDAKHGSVVYATLIAENHAGLRSVFRAAPITMDASAPEFSGTPWLVMEDVTNATQAALVTWEVDDAESGVAKCFCGIGHQPSADDIHSFAPADNTASCRLEFPSLQHGDVVYATVLCVNNVELSAEASSRPITVTEEAPSGESVQLSVMPSNIDSTRTALRNPLLPVQSNLTSMKLEWLGFADDIEIERFEYCLKQGGAVVRGDTSVERQTMARIDGLGLQSDQVYTVEVAAVSQGDHKSDPVSADVLLLGSGPPLTGNQIRKSSYGANLEYIDLDWSGVFHVHVNTSVSYALDVGSMNGYDDVISNHVTSGTSHSFKNPGSTLLSTIVQELYIVLTATYDTGRFTIYRGIQKLSV